MSISETELIRHLRAAGLRLTPQRLIIWRALQRLQGHPSAQEVHAIVQTEHPSLGLATVYNALDLFAQLGLLRAFESGGVTRYDTDPSPHLNLICDQCGRIEDLHLPERDAWQARIESLSGYHVRGCTIDVHGICPDCQTRKNMEALS